MGAKDFYKILGVGESAGQDEIKTAYRRLAKQYHPDANAGDKQAEEKFKEVSEAYEVLSDPKKRQQYDQMRKFGMGGGPYGRGFQGFDFGNFDFGGFQRQRPGTGRGFKFDGFDMFGGLGDIFAQFFDMGEQTRRERSGPQRGEDLMVELSVPFEQAVAGGKSSFTVEKEKICPVCNGGGAKPGSKVQACPDCGGRGRVTISQGGFGVSRPCPKCLGKGQIITNPCDKCHGTGQVRGKRTYSIRVPPGAEDGKQIRLKKEGQPGSVGGPPGDMIIRIRTQPHRFFQRQGSDILCEVPLTLKQAVSGSKLRVKTVDGKKVELKIPPGTKDGTSFRMAGMGVSCNGKKGCQYVTVRVKIPENPSEEEKKLVEQLAQEKSS